MGLCNIGGKDGYLRKMISDKLNSLGVTVAKAYDSAATFVSNIQTAVNNADAAGYTRGSSDAKQGTATEGQVLTGYTFTNQNGLYSGSMPNRGALNWNPTTSTTYSVPAGYYSGGTLNSSNAYNSGSSSGASSARTGMALMGGSGVDKTKTMTLQPGTYEFDWAITGYGNYVGTATLLVNGSQVYKKETTNGETYTYSSGSETYTLTSVSSCTITLYGAGASGMPSACAFWKKS